MIQEPGIPGARSARAPAGWCAILWQPHATIRGVPPEPALSRLITPGRRRQSVAQRFWSKVRKHPNGCWLWTGSVRPDGYGRFHLEAGQVVTAHRLAYELGTGQKPDGWVVCHRCDTPLCVNPGHLFLGSVADNNRDMAEKGRALSGTRNRAAKLTSQQVAEIRARYERGGVTQTALAREYGVSQARISHIVNWEGRIRA